MLGWLPPPLTGVIVAALLLVNLLFWAVPVYLLIFLKLLTWGQARVAVSRWIADTAQIWAAINVWVWRKMLDMHWDIRGVETLSRKGKYLVVSNHQSWNDIPMQMVAFDRKAPFFKFFIKQELIWVPILGPVWWGLDFPFMKRSTPEQIKKDPSLRGRDLQTTREACEKYRVLPVMILNFLEGTRFTPAKHSKQSSPYKYLLKPRTGGLALVLGAMGEMLDAVLDMTIVYPKGGGGLWDLLCGRIPSVIVEVRRIDVPPEFNSGDYANDPEFRKQIQRWVGDLWQQKDQRIQELLVEAGVETRADPNGQAGGSD